MLDLIIDSMKILVVSPNTYSYILSFFHTYIHEKKIMFVEGTIVQAFIIKKGLTMMSYIGLRKILGAKFSSWVIFWQVSSKKDYLICLFSKMIFPNSMG